MAERSSLYAQYLAERTYKRIIEDEFGFIVFEVHPDCVLINELFVVPEERRKGRGLFLGKEVESIAKSIGKKLLVCTVDPRAKNAGDSIKAILAMGMSLSRVKDNLIYLIKEL